MTWAKKLFKESRIKVPVLNNTDVISCPDLVSAVLEKNKEIKKLVNNYCKKHTRNDTNAYTCLAEARAFQQLVKECKKEAKP